MILSGGGRDVTVPGKNIKVQGTLSIARKDMSGFDSATDSVNGGTHKGLTVALQLPYTDIAQLQELTAVAEAVDDAGAPVAYDIVDLTARGLNIRQVIFADTMRVVEGDSLQAWGVSFTLQEHRSVAELLEERLDTQAVAAVTADGTTITGTGANAHAKLLQVTGNQAL